MAIRKNESGAQPGRAAQEEALRRVEAQSQATESGNPGFVVSPAELDEVEPEPIQPDFETTVQNWIDANVTSGSPITYKIYKDKGKVGPWPWCADYTDYPELGDIGRRFGGGRFQLRLVSVDANTQEQRVSGTYIFELDESYNELHRLALEDTQILLAQKRAAMSPVPQQQSQQLSGSDPAASLNASISLLGTIMDKVVAPLLKAREPLSPPDPSGTFAIMTQQAATMSKMYLQNTIENAKAITEAVSDMREEFANREEEEEEPEEQEQPPQQQLPAVPQEPQPDVVDYLVGLAEEYGPAIVGETGAASKVLVGLIKTAPLWKQMLAKPNNFSKVLAGLDSKMGPAKVDQFLNALGVQRP